MLGQLYGARKGRLQRRGDFGERLCDIDAVENIARNASEKCARVRLEARKRLQFGHEAVFEHLMSVDENVAAATLRSETGNGKWEGEQRNDTDGVHVILWRGARNGDWLRFGTGE